MLSISDRISSKQAELEAMRRVAGEAVLDGADFDTSKISAVEAELAALTSAEGVEAVRGREGARRAREARRGALKDTIKREERERLAAITEADEAVQALVDALTRAMDASGKIHTAIHELTGRGAMGFQPLHFENRLSTYLAADMRRLKDGPRGGRFGFINWPTHPPRKHDAWASEENTLVAGDLAQALK
jgi:hypothetical protein